MTMFAFARHCSRSVALLSTRDMHCASRVAFCSNPRPDTSYLSATRANRDGFGFKHRQTTYRYDVTTSEYVCTIKLHDVCETHPNKTVYTKGIEVVGTGKSKIAAHDEAANNAEDVMEDLAKKAKTHEQA